MSLFRVNIRTFKPIPRLTRFTWFHKDWEKSWRALNISLISDLVMKKQWILIKGTLFGDFKLFYFLTWADKRHKLSWDDEIPRNLPALQSCLINTHLTSKTPQKTPRKDKNTLKVFLVTKHDRRINSSPKKKRLNAKKKIAFRYSLSLPRQDGRPCKSRHVIIHDVNSYPFSRLLFFSLSFPSPPQLSFLFSTFSFVLTCFVYPSIVVILRDHRDENRVLSGIR